MSFLSLRPREPGECSSSRAAAPFSVAATTWLLGPNGSDCRAPSCGVGGVIVKAEPGEDERLACSQRDAK